MNSDDNVEQALKKRHVNKVVLKSVLDKTNEDNHNILRDAGSATEMNERDNDDGSLLDNLFIFTEKMFDHLKAFASKYKDDDKETDLKHDNRAKIWIAQQLGKVEGKKQSKAEKSERK